MIKLNSLLHNNYFYLLVIIMAATLAYLNVGNVGFYLDDYSSIVNNPAVQGPFNLDAVITAHKSRLVPYTLLALQNDYFAASPEGFHYTGLVIHLLMTTLLFLIGDKLFSLSKLSKAQGLAGVAALVFAVHPQNSQAVIYIVQQTAIYVAIFYLAALYCYIKLREQGNNKKCIVWLGLVIAFALLAGLSKQNAVTLPLAILLLEWCFYQKWQKHIIILYTIFALVGVSSIILLTHFDLSELITYIDSSTKETEKISRSSYFLSQVNIVADYIIQFVFPTGLRLEYDTDVANSFYDLNIIAVCLHLLLLSFAVLLRNRIPVFTFGILFYYLAHLVESSFIPITDLVFEHRTYLPNAGLILASIGLLAAVQKNAKPIFKNVLAAIMLIILGIFVLLTQARVEQWADQKSFYENETKLSPESPRAYSELAKMLINEGNCPLAIGYSSHALSLYEKQRESGLKVQPEFYQNYILCLRQLKIYDKADYYEQHLLKVVKEPVRRSYILFQRGTFLLEQRQFKQAEKLLTESIKLNGKNYGTAVNLAIVKVQLGKTTQAIRLLKHALALKPNDSAVLDMLKKLER